ncbi:MAG: LysM peptidoglycan-binding domain-containing protein [Reichenbachiella sp.]|uniref:muramidase family protein n=1 Tax=Reichenbachiella sp. TaxID=2184521 RepID=UPI003299DE83
MIYRLLFFLIWMGIAHFGYANNPMDSLRVEKIKGKKYIIHRADPKETLYSITKRYGVTLEDLYEFNPTLKTNGLKMYDTIQVPLLKKKKKQEAEITLIESDDFHVVQVGETLFAISRMYNMSVDSIAAINQLENANLSVGDTLYTTPQSKIASTPALDPEVKYHIVQPSETLFGISRMYQVEIEEIQQWNNLPDYTLSIGQKLVVSDGIEREVKDTVALAPIVKKEVDSSYVKPEKPPLDTLYVKTDNSKFKTKTNEVEGRKQTMEEGFAMKIEDTDYTKKFLALHRTAPLGSSIQVKNQMTNQIIEAKVVGKLPESAMNRTLLLRLSSAAYKAMGAIDLKTPITVSYSLDAE